MSPIKTILSGAMVRNSKQREAILRVVRGSHNHPTADWVYEQVRKEIPNISLGTVYRNLKLLVQEGELLQLEFAGTPIRFDGDTRIHNHFRCDRCGHIFNVYEVLDKDMDDRLAKQTGFKVSHHRLEFRGLCKGCQSEITRRQ